MEIDATRLIQKLNDLPDAQRGHIRKAMSLNVTEGVQVARALAPERSGQTRDEITGHMALDGMSGEIVAIDPSAPGPEKNRAYSIEHGRKEGNRGVTEGSEHMWQTRQHLGKKFKGRIKRAVKKAVKEVSNRG